MQGWLHSPVPLGGELLPCSRSQETSQSLSMPPQCCRDTNQEETAATKHVMARAECILQSKAAKRQNVQNYTHTQYAEKMAHCDYRDERRKSGRGGNTDSGRKVVKEILSFWNCTIFLNHYLKEGRGRCFITAIFLQVSSWKIRLCLFVKYSNS